MSFQRDESAAPSPLTRPIVGGRYELCDEIGVGGMATVHFGRILGDGGFTRPVAIKRLHPHLARDPAFVAAFVDEAHLAVRISHPNVVSTLDVVLAEGELLLIMEYVDGASLSHLLQVEASRCELAAIPRVVAVMVGALGGLQAAHEAVDEKGAALGLVHRDVSPQNIMVGTDGRARMLDFGVAKATGRRARERTRTGVIKGKLGYVAPEQFDGTVTHRSDIYAAAVVLWEALAGRRLFDGDTDGEIIHRVLTGKIDPPSVHRQDISAELDAVVLRALSMEPAQRFGSAAEMATALRAAMEPASMLDVAGWVQRLKGEVAPPPASTVRVVPTAVPSVTRTEILAVQERPRRARTAGRALVVAALAVAGLGVVMVARRPSPATLPVQGAVAAVPLSTAVATPPIASSSSDARQEALAPLPSRSVAVAPQALRTPNAPSTPARHVTPAPRPSPTAPRSRSPSATILGVLDTRQ